MRRIILNARFLGQLITGVQRYALEVVRALDSLIEKGEINSERYSFVLLTPKGSKYNIKFKHIRLLQAGLLSGHLWEQLELPIYVRNNVLVNLCNTGPVLKKKQIIVIHDTAVFAIPDAFSWIFRKWYQLLLPALAQKARCIITVSEFSKRQIAEYCGIANDKIHAIYEGKEHVLRCRSDESVLSKWGLGKKRFVLGVGTMKTIKNFASLICATDMAKRNELDFVVVGGTNPRVFKKTEKVSLSNMKWIGYVSDSELKALYENAVCLIYPSFYEGFGLPPIEAMACGCPVIVSNVPSLAEVCGDAVLFCDPYRPEDISIKIHRVINDMKLQEDLRAKGLVRANHFSWENCARETWSVIEEVIAL